MKSEFDYRLKGKNFVVTGCTSGIGYAIAKKLVEEKANLFLIARKIDPLLDLKQELFEIYPLADLYTFSADLSNLEATTQIMRAIGRLAQIDGLINMVGFAYPEYFEKMPPRMFEESMRHNYLSAVNCAYGAVPYMKKGSFISFASSVAGYMGVFGYSAYSGPKFALMGFAETLKQELKHRKISISVLCPPDTQTRGYEKEDKTKPFETRKLSGNAKLMSPEAVAMKLLKGAIRKKFLIICNFESALYYHLRRLFPGLFRWIMGVLVKHYRKKNPNV